MTRKTILAALEFLAGLHPTSTEALAKMVGVTIEQIFADLARHGPRVERAICKHQTDDNVRALRSILGSNGNQLAAAVAARNAPLAEIERLYVLQVLRDADDNRTVAAERLGIARKTLYRKLETYVD